MRYGYLSDYFSGVAVKRLREVEVNPKSSNQHELNGAGPLKQLLTTEEFYNRPATFIWLGGENEGVSEEGWLSWYDARKRQAHRSPEWRLYYPANAVMELASPGDLLVIARLADGRVALVVTPQGTTLENQLIWLFGLEGGLGEMFHLEEFGGGNDRELDFAARYILEELGVEIHEPEADRLDALLERFEARFPGTREFSALARDSIESPPVCEAPDETLIAWMTHEEALFRRLERHVVSERLTRGFAAEGTVDVDGFLHFSLSVQNRRKVRVGFALENHLEAIFEAHDLQFARGVQTENRAKPDFLFPGGEEYHDPTFPSGRLSMLGAKSTCKDRWRQVLTEAQRIRDKHLLTLEPGISEHQTSEMQANNLQLVVPAPISQSYKPEQREWLMNVENFIDLVKARQS